MKPEDAAKKLSFHLMQCGALMPMDWIRENGEGSELQQAFRMALDALRDGERLRTELEQVKRERDAAVEFLESAIRYSTNPCEGCEADCIDAGSDAADRVDQCGAFDWRGKKED